jgi:hypothetical protein
MRHREPLGGGIARGVERDRATTRRLGHKFMTIVPMARPSSEILWSATRASPEGLSVSGTENSSGPWPSWAEASLERRALMALATGLCLGAASLGGQTRGRCSGLQTVVPGLANKGRFRLTFRANKLTVRPTISANEPTFCATSLQIIIWAQIQCTQESCGMIFEAHCLSNGCGRRQYGVNQDDHISSSAHGRDRCPRSLTVRARQALQPAAPRSPAP